VERRANGAQRTADGKSARGPAGLSGLARSSKHTEEIDRSHQMHQLPSTRREVVSLFPHSPHSSILRPDPKYSQWYDDGHASVAYG
jgi:hypothetical protein